MKDLNDDRPEEAEEPETESFTELVKYTLSGFIGGLVLAAILDWLGFQRNPIGQWIVRTLAGEGESIFEGTFAIRSRLRGAAGSLAEAYGWGKLLGMIFPWIIDWGSRWAGIDVYGVEGFYIPYFYAMSDQIGGNLSGLIFMRRRQDGWLPTFGRYLRHPVMLASLAVILLVPLGLLTVRLAGFSPTTQVYTALETIAANLCWVPPVVGWLVEKRRGK
jgi:hypothetical protein